VRARTKELGEARRSRSLKGQERLTTHEKPTPILHVSEPTHTNHAVPEAALATKYPELKPTIATAAPLPQARSPPPRRTLPLSPRRVVRVQVLDAD
jgi:hypothetical protein